MLGFKDPNHLEHANDSVITSCVQTSQSKKSKKATSKVLSPMTPQLPVAADSEKREKLPPRELIPYSVVNVTGEDCPSVTDVLSAARLPSLDQARLAPFSLANVQPDVFTATSVSSV